MLTVTLAINQKGVLFIVYHINDFMGISEQEIYKKILSYNNLLRTNCENASMNLYVIISNVCYFKNVIIPSLVRIFIRPLYYLGLGKSQDILNWIEWFITDKIVQNYTSTIKGININALKWFFECLNTDNTYIEEALRELKACNELQDVYFSLKKDVSQNCFVYTNSDGNTYSFTEFQQFREFAYEFIEKRVSKSEVENIMNEEIDFLSEKFKKDTP